MWEHTPWFKPYVAGYYAHMVGLPDDRETVMARMEEYLQIGQATQEHEQCEGEHGANNDNTVHISL
jgi:hypothetical protein